MGSSILRLLSIFRLVNTGWRLWSIFLLKTAVFLLHRSTCLMDDTAVFSLHWSTCSMDDNCLGWFMVSALVMRKSTGRFKPTRNGETDFQLIIIIFIVPPTIQPLQNKTITVGGNLNLYCNASGTPPPVVSWARISGQQFNGSLLQLTNVFRNQAGDYRCEASNTCGTKSSTARICVKCKCLFKHGATAVCGSLVNT